MFVFGLLIGIVIGVLAVLGILMWAYSFDYGEAFHKAYHPDSRSDHKSNGPDHRAYRYDPPRAPEGWAGPDASPRFPETPKGSEARPKGPPLKRPATPGPLPMPRITHLSREESDLKLEELRRHRDADLAEQRQEEDTRQAAARARQDARTSAHRADLKQAGLVYSPERAQRELRVQLAETDQESRNTDGNTTQARIRELQEEQVEGLVQED
jgi:hypothetical protein